MNVEKTQCLCVEEEITNLFCCIKNSVVYKIYSCIKKCKSYKYLRINFNEEGTYNVEIKSRINKATKIIRLLNGILWSTEIGKEMKKRIYDSMIKSTLMLSLIHISFLEN